MKELIEQIKLKADSIPTNTRENRRVKGAYVDCLMMVKEASKNLVLAPVSGLVCVNCNDTTDMVIGGLCSQCRSDIDTKQTCH